MNPPLRHSESNRLGVGLRKVKMPENDKVPSILTPFCELTIVNWTKMNKERFITICIKYLLNFKLADLLLIKFKIELSIFLYPRAMFGFSPTLTYS